jgi:hypothetical protein
VLTYTAMVVVIVVVERERERDCKGVWDSYKPISYLEKIQWKKELSAGTLKSERREKTKGCMNYQTLVNYHIIHIFLIT